jgi:hypothetical protein
LPVAWRTRLAGQFAAVAAGFTVRVPCVTKVVGFTEVEYRKSFVLNAPQDKNVFWDCVW